jgi:hypothetical protein
VTAMTARPPMARQAPRPSRPPWYVLPETGALPTAPRDARAHVQNILKDDAGAHPLTTGDAA